MDKNRKKDAGHEAKDKAKGDAKKVNGDQVDDRSEALASVREKDLGKAQRRAGKATAEARKKH